MTTFWTVVVVIAVIYSLLAVFFAIIIRGAPQIEHQPSGTGRKNERHQATVHKLARR